MKNGARVGVRLGRGGETEARKERRKLWRRLPWHFHLFIVYYMFLFGGGGLFLNATRAVRPHIHGHSTPELETMYSRVDGWEKSFLNIVYILEFYIPDSRCKQRHSHREDARNDGSERMTTGCTTRGRFIDESLLGSRRSRSWSWSWSLLRVARRCTPR